LPTGCTDEPILFLEFGALPQNTSEGIWYHHLLAWTPRPHRVQKCCCNIHTHDEIPSHTYAKHISTSRNQSTEAQW